MTTYYATEATRRNLPGQNNVMPTELGGQIRLAHDWFIIDSGDIPATVDVATDDVISLNSILIPAKARVLGGFMTCDRLVSSSPGEARVELGTAADMASVTAVLDLRFGADPLLDVWLNDDALNSNYHALTVWDPVNDTPYVDRIPEDFCAWIRPDATSNDWDQAAFGAAVGIYYVSD